jgi:uncharacterized membrane protein
MAVLVMGLVMVRSIFKGSTENINVIDQKVKDQINKLFSEDELKQVIVYPSNYIQLNKGKSAGFGLSIRNVESQGDTFSYSIASQSTSCGVSTDAADDLISLGKTGTNIKIAPGTIMQDPIYVRFDIPENFPPCQIRYNIDIKKSGVTYASTVQVDVEVLSK